MRRVRIYRTVRRRLHLVEQIDLIRTCVQRSRGVATPYVTSARQVEPYATSTRQVLTLSHLCWAGLTLRHLYSAGFNPASPLLGRF